MLTAAAVIPAAPLLAPGVVDHIPDSLRSVADCAAVVVERLPPADVVIVVTSGDGAVYDRSLVDLSGLGTPQVVTEFSSHQGVVDGVCERTDLRGSDATPLPVDAAGLALHTRDRWPVVAITVVPWSSWDALCELGERLVRLTDDLGLTAVIMVSGDGAAGLTPKAPRALISQAGDWQAQLIDAFEQGQTKRLSRLGPAAAAAVHARGWAPMALLHGATAYAKLGVVLREHGAPRGVGYIVAHGS